MLIVIPQLFPLTLFHARPHSYTQKHSSTANMSITQRGWIPPRLFPRLPPVFGSLFYQKWNSVYHLWCSIHSFSLVFPALQVACMQLINALVTSPDDLDFRIHLRNEFLRCGLKKILPVSYQHNTRFQISRTQKDKSWIVWGTDPYCFIPKAVLKVNCYVEVLSTWIMPELVNGS